MAFYISRCPVGWRECIRKNYYKETNILITQVESVVSAGILMPEFKKAGEWLNEGTAKITEQVEAQFLGDGVCM